MLQLRDPTHASGRFLKVWTADHFLGAVFDLFIGHKGSIISLIQYSPDIQRIFAKHMGDSDGNSQVCQSSKISSVSFKKHRFNSAQEPLSRLNFLYMLTDAHICIN
eukprot:12422704-Karenia_brevis.AAC.1